MRLDSLLLSNQTRGWWLFNGRGSYRELLPEAAITITIQASAPLCICGFCNDSDTRLTNVHLDTDEHKGLFGRLLEASLGASRKAQMPCC